MPRCFRTSAQFLSPTLVTASEGGSTRFIDGLSLWAKLLVLTHFLEPSRLRVQEAKEGSAIATAGARSNREMSTLHKPIVVRVPWPSTRVDQARVVGWCFSIAFHATLIAAVAWFFPYWAIPQRGVPNGNGTSFDLTLLGPGDSFGGRGNKDGAGGDPGRLEFVAATVEPIEPARDPATIESETEENAADENTPAETESAALEPPLPSPNQSGGRRVLPPRVRPFGGAKRGSELASAQGDGGTGGSGRAMGGTRFFGAAGAGKKFVYVIDCSSSMRSDNAIGIARAELDASLRDLDPSKQFQVIVYNMKQSLIPSSSGDSRQKYLSGTEANRAVAMQFIKSVVPDGGTDRYPALKKALELRPDVVFFLTDADFPILEPADMQRIRQMNRGGTQIHVIEFGKGGQLKDDNFLKVLAHQNHGTYSYHDVLVSRKLRE